MTIILQALFPVFIEMSCVNIFFRTFLKLRLPEKKWLSKLMVCVLTGLAITVSITLAEQHVARAVVVIMLITIAMLIVYECRVKQAVFYSFCFYGIGGAIDLGFMVILGFLLQERLTQMLAEPVSSTLLITLSKSFLFLIITIIYWRFSRESREKHYELPENYEWILFLFFPVISIVIMMLFFIEGYNSVVVLIASFGSVAINLVLFQVLQKFVLRTKEEQEAKLIAERARSQIEFYESMKITYQEQSSKEHEFKNHIGGIQSLLESDNKDGALEYMGNIIDKIEGYFEPYNTENTIVNAVINQKYWQGKNQGINIIFLLDELSEITMADDDLLILLSNLLNNAIEACQKFPEGKERRIHFRFQLEDKKVIIATKNPILSPVKITLEGILSSKRNNKGYGIGLANIKKIVEKYGGESVCSNHDEYFYHTTIFEKEKVSKNWTS